MRKITVNLFFWVFFGFISGFNPCLASNILDINKPEVRQKIIARVNDQDIRIQDVVEFARSAPNFLPYLQLPGGPEKILDEMIWRRLLILEGRDRGIPEPTEEEGGEELYILRVKNRLFPDFSPLSEHEARFFYETHPEEFSTPLMLRISQIKVFIKNGNVAEARNRIEAARKALDSGKAFEQVAKKYSEDEFSRERGGDLGFIPMENIDQPQMEKLLMDLPVGGTSQIVRTGNAFVIYRITGRIDPVLDPYDRVSDLAHEKAERYRNKQALDILRKELESKWGVTYPDSEWRLKDRKESP
jgi:hypothetical protein